MKDWSGNKQESFEEFDNICCSWLFVQILVHFSGHRWQIMKSEDGDLLKITYWPEKQHNHYQMIWEFTNTNTCLPRHPAQMNHDVFQQSGSYVKTCWFELESHLLIVISLETSKQVTVSGLVPEQIIKHFVTNYFNKWITDYITFQPV